MDRPQRKPPRLATLDLPIAQYGPAQEKYNVSQGEVWQVGNHTLICGDAIELHESGKLNDYIPDCTYTHTDPPWTSGIYNKFYYWAAEDPKPYSTGKAPITFVDFTIRLCKLIGEKTQAVAMIDCGYSLHKTLPGYLRSTGADILDDILCTYTKRSIKYWMLVATWSNAVLPPNLTALGKHDDEIILSVANAITRPGTSMFDPMGGVFSFLVPAAERGATCYGIELIPRKFAEGLNNFAKFGELKLVDRWTS